MPHPRIPSALSAVLLLAGVGTFCAGATRAQEQALPQAAPQDLATYPRTMLTIKSGSAVHTFTVWVADTPPRQEQGLMFVRDLPADEGMLFTHCCTGIWMKNTYIELDIVFIGPDGRITKIAERARPFDETTIGAPGVAEAVVELKGGEAAHLNLKVGDHVQWDSSTGKAAAKAG